MLRMRSVDVVVDDDDAGDVPPFHGPGGDPLGLPPRPPPELEEAPPAIRHPGWCECTRAEALEFAGMLCYLVLCLVFLPVMLAALLLYGAIALVSKVVAPLVWWCVQPACCWSRRWCYVCRRANLDTLRWAVREQIPSAVRAISRQPGAALVAGAELPNELARLFARCRQPEHQWSRLVPVRHRADTVLALLDHPDMARPHVAALLALHYVVGLEDERVFERMVQLGASTTAPNPQAVRRGMCMWAGWHGGASPRRSHLHVNCTCCLRLPADCALSQSQQPSWCQR
jgi:hypothetical protein